MRSPQTRMAVITGCGVGGHFNITRQEVPAERRKSCFQQKKDVYTGIRRQSRDHLAQRPKDRIQGNTD